MQYCSRYIEIDRLNRSTSDEIITQVKSVKPLFARYGIPEKVVTDNGPQFSSTEFSQFSITTSSPYFPQSNGEAERAVQTVKSILRKSEDPYLALLIPLYRLVSVLHSY